ncbi:hypothetical protein D6C85_10455 [Aureobasidium pullulans]|uniref:C2H2-type domain-containing protein n=1 Tax=Aureobasidium pullulans TaxID=5580 RepID=A0A4V4KUC3_AURPU|nr:hypothetical protein D6C85_10455 [Aureobasidium pullulans]
MNSQAPSLASLSSELLVQVQELCLRTDRDATEFSTSLNDASTRFRMWGFNIHAFQDDQTSLEYQIRKALSLQKGFRQRLQDLKEDLADLDDSLSAITSADMLTHAPPTREDGTMPTPTQDAHVEAFTLLKAIHEDISSLFKLSALVETATFQDDYAIASASIEDQASEEKFSVWTINEHLPQTKWPSWLLQRLLRASQARRKYLKYRRVHQDTGKDPSQQILARRSENETKNKSNIPPVNRLDQSGEVTTDPGRLASVQEDNLNDNISQATRDHFGSNNTLTQVLTIETLEEVCQGQDVFVCPYCKERKTIKTEAAWRRHVFSDLKAYVCTVAECELHMFTSSEAWMSHQLSEHLVAWNCPICDETPFFSGEYFQSHIRFCHPAEFSEEQLEQLTTSSKHSADSIRASECTFCDWAVASGDLDRCTFQDGEVHVTPELFQRHVCSHLEQLALSTSLWTEEDDRKDRIETGSRQDHITMISDGFSATIRNLENIDAVNEAYTGMNDEDPFLALQQQRWDFDTAWTPIHGLDDMSSRTHSSTTSGTRSSNTSRTDSSTTSRTYSSNTSRTYSSNTSSAESGTTSSRPHSSLVFPRNVPERYNYTNEQPFRHHEVDLSNQWTGMYWEIAEAEKQSRSRVSNMRAALELELQGQTSEGEEGPAVLVAPSRSRRFPAHSPTKDVL